jgi:protein-L-isoaspartate(D-aspartate) O-methyltransferase
MMTLMNKLPFFITMLVTLLIPSMLFAQARPTDEVFAARRKEMVEKQVHGRGVMDKSVLEAMMKVERHIFVPDELCDMAYEDTPVPIKFDQTVSQPYIVGFMTEALKISPKDKILEIGTGSGYQSAILGELAREVYTIEVVRPLGEQATERLEKLGYKNVHVRIGDGYKGWPEEAPFDAIIATAAPLDVPDTLVSQLKIGGRMIIPVGSVFQELFLITRNEKGYDKQPLLPVKFVPMITPYSRKDRSKDGESGYKGLFK